MLRPPEIRLEASTACQLRCPACPTTLGKIRDRLGTGFLPFERFRRLIDENPWIRIVELSNWGEIFLNPELIDIVRHAHERGVRLKAKNGVNFNHVSEEVLRALVEYRFFALKFSIDGASPETYGRYRRRGDFDRVMRNVRRLVELKREHGSEFPRLKWQFIPFGHNEHEIERARELARELGMRFWVKLAWKTADSLETMDDVRDEERVARATGLGVATRAQFLERYRERYLQRHSCTQLWTSPQINWDGRLLGCNILHGGDFGDVFRDGLEATLNGERISYARRMLTGRAPPRADIPCTDCKHYRSMREHGRWIRPADVAPKEERRRPLRRRVRRRLKGLAAAAVPVVVERARSLVAGRPDWLRRKQPGASSRSRGLERFAAVFGEERVREVMERAAARRERPRVVEIGCGEGRLLLELLREHGPFEAHGINKRPWPAMTGRRSFARTARRYGVLSRRELRAAGLPTAWFLDAETLPFDDASVDVVVSQVAVPYVRRKDRVLEEVWRVLRPGGVALLHLDTRVEASPDFLAPPTPRFAVLDDRDRPLPLPDLLETHREAGFGVTLREVESGDAHGRVRVLLEMERTLEAPLVLGLVPEEASTFNLSRLRPVEGPHPVYWGHRSVFRTARNVARPPAT